ncbi:DUF4198 domain-containing protein [Brevibacillus migulae]|uniref:DUF4198 domain-containing protein n=1 Tax=Brevibacillus migulae TaxID=1644114 RepID=UPI00106DD4AA|nr:DUF4198 domain-containing protein [Brevibacillus migulae]
MKKMASLLTAASLSLALSVPAFAHDGWSQTNAPIIASGEVSYVELLLGNHSNHHASYRIEGKWSTDTSKVFVTTPAGKKSDITATLFYTGEMKETEEPGKNNSYISTFSASQPGAYIISVEGDSIFKSGEVASRTLRNAKSFVAVSDIPTLERVKGLKGFSKPVSPDRAELVPQFNPAAITPDQNVSVQLLLKGKPLADTEVSIIRRSTSDAQVLKTDKDGLISFKTGPADYYLLRAKPTTAEKEAGKYDTTNYEATMTFTVQNGKSALSPSAAAGKPALYVNGKAVDVQGLDMQQGKFVLPAEQVKNAVDPSFNGTGTVELDKAIESLGGSVEVLAPVGAIPAAIHIHTDK